MDKKAFWCIVYANVIGIRCHPRNDEFNEGLSVSADMAREAADLAVRDFEQVFCERGLFGAPGST